MISTLYKAVAAGLKVVKPCKIYREDVPQGFTTPCFLVEIIDQGPMSGINGRLKNTISLDILYFPQNMREAELEEECWTVGETLTRELSFPGFRIVNRNLKIEDKKLHFLCDISYREFCNGTDPKMQKLSQNIKQ